MGDETFTSECNDEDLGDDLQCQEQNILFSEGSLSIIPRKQKSQKLQGALVAGSVIVPCAES